MMKEAVELIVRKLVREPEFIEVRVAEGDVGKIIGRQGRTVKALRSLLHAAGQKHSRRYLLEIVE
jgi:predicted RNA-binding protein YlqC (UPF0109 family)